jgi:subtilisin family serine protease
MRLIRILFVMLSLVFTFSCQKPDEVYPNSKTENETLSSDTENCPSGKKGQIVQGRYIVFFKEDTSIIARNARTFNSRSYIQERIRNLLARKRNRGSFDKVYYSVLQGFTGHFSKDDIKEIQSDSEVDFVIQDYFITLDAVKIENISSDQLQQTPWGVARVGQGKAGNNIAWILDTGLDTEHPDLNVDLSRSKSFVCSEPSVKDLNGHGTHVAGIIAAKDNAIGVVGVAPGNSIVGLKVMNKNGIGTASDLLEGLDYVNQHAVAGDVVNLSLSGEANDLIDRMVNKISMEKNVYVVMAAGNDKQDASKSSPQRLQNSYVFTISAMDSTYRFADFSNYGSCIAYCAPGVEIRSAHLNGQYATLSGTSMAAPHFAGMLLQKGKSIVQNGFVKNDPDGIPDPIPVLRDLPL